MMLKVAAIGLLLMLVSGVLVRAIGKWPGPVVGLPIVAAWFGGAAMAFCGLVAALWW